MSYPDLVLADGPVAYWRLNESSGTTAVDISGNGHDLTYDAGVNLGAAGPIQGGSAAEFDGDPQRITRADDDAFDALSGLTLECWVWWDGLSGGTGDADQMFIHKWVASVGPGWYFGRLGSSNELRFTTGNGRDDWDVSFTPNLSTWYHLVATYDGATKRIYVNGSKVGGDHGETGTLDDNAAALQIGNFADGTWQLDGRIAEVAVYDYALTAAQVSTHYAGSAPVGGYRTRTKGKYMGELVAWDINGKAVPVEWDTATMVANGGYDQMQGSIPERFYRASMTQGSVVTGYRPNGRVLWKGVIQAPPKLSFGQAHFTAEGYSSWARRADSRLPYQIRDASAWKLAHEAPFNYTTGEKYAPEARGDSIGFQVSKDETYGVGTRHAYALYVAGWPVRSIGFTIMKSHDDGNFVLELRGGNDLGSLSAITTWALGAANPSGTAKTYNLTTDYDTLVLGIYCDTGNTPAQSERFWLKSLRVTCIGSDGMATSSIVADVAARLGFSTNYNTGTINANPLDWSSGPWDELLDYMAGLEDWVWLVTESETEVAELSFRPWGRHHWRTSLEQATENLIVAPLYNKVTTYFERPAGVPQSRSATAQSIGLDDPLPPGVTYEWPSPITLRNPQVDHRNADSVNARILNRVTKVRLQGTIMVHGLENGEPHDIWAGDTISIGGFIPEAGPQRIASVSYNRDGTTTCTLDRTYDVGTLLYRLEKNRQV